MTPGPADEARRALRAARERAAGETRGDGGPVVGAADDSAASGAGHFAAEEGGGPAVREVGNPAASEAGSSAAGGIGDRAVQSAGGAVAQGAEGREAEEVGDPGTSGTGLDRDRAQGSESHVTKGPGSSAADRMMRGAGRLAVERGGSPSGQEESGPAAQGAGGAATGAERSAAEGAVLRGDADANGSGTADGQDREGAVPESAVTDPAPAEPRPGDAVRAALREAAAARRDALADGATGRSETGADGDSSEPVNPAQSHTPRQEAVAARHDSSGEPDMAAAPTASVESTPEETDRVGEAASPVADAGEDASAGRSGARPADAAREALRAARKRRADAEAAEAEAALARRPRRTTPSASRDRSRTPSTAAGVRARDVRELLADAFRMPDDMPQPGEGHEDEGGERGQEKVRGNSLTRQGSSPQDVPGPASPRHPHSMAAPNRDNDLRRTFPAFPPHASEDARFAATWWGNAWVTALEEGALDAKRLARGRGYAEQGNVDAITVTPGLVLAYVQGSRARPYRVQVRLRTLGDADWDRFLDLAADRTGHIAALLDREMPEALAECGVPLLPGPGDLEPQCSCPDRGHPCKHAAALCYQTARLLDADPFVLLLLRGRGERELLDALSRLSAARAARAAQGQEPAPLPGVRAGEALAPRRLPPLPAPLPVPPHPEQPPAYPASPGGPDPFALDQLATDAAVRAHALLSTGRDPVGELTLWQDAVRLAAARPGSGLTAGTRSLYASLAAATDRTPADLARAVAAWRQGGLEGLAVLEDPWDPPAGRFDRARPLLLAADLPVFRPWRNHLTHPRGHIQLRLGRDGLWYAYESEPGHDDWWPRGTPDLDPVGALTGLGTTAGL
ncbi:putative Zn finger protein [Streptomyces sp. SLBN-8D4]